MVFDNADDISMWTGSQGSDQLSCQIMDYLPTSQDGRIVFTSRDRKTAYDLVQRGHIVEVLAVGRLADVIPDNENQNRSIWTRYLIHARYALASRLIDQDGERRIDLAWKVGNCLNSDGRWQECWESVPKAVAAWQGGKWKALEAW